MTSLIRFLKSHDPDIALISEAAFAHVEFVTIYPFPVGDGTMGRLLVTLIMCQAVTLNQPLLYLSLHYKRHRMDCYNLLTRVRETGSWV